MNPVSGGWTSHKIRSDDYEGKKRAALAQSGQNSYIQGVQSVMEDGAGSAVAATRDERGITNLPVNQLIQGKNSNFQQGDSPGNQPFRAQELANQTGSVMTETSSTNVPQQDPEDMEYDALDRRLNLMAKGGQGFPGLNNRNREV